MIREIKKAYQASQHLNRVRFVLDDTFDPEGIRHWLTNRNKRLGHHTPLELILDGFGEIVVADAELLSGQHPW